MFTIFYASSVEGWQGYKSLLENLIDHYELKKLCDLGGGVNPVLTTDIISSRDLDYTILDISENELGKAPDQYKKLAQDIMANDLSSTEKFDLVFTKMFAEHVKDGALLHRNVYSLLNPGGFAVHFFPTLYALPFLVNRLLPETFASALLDFFAPRDKDQHAKFPAYYSWCRRPTMKMAERFSGIGYEIVEYRGFSATTAITKNFHVSETAQISFKLFFKAPQSTLYQLRRGRPQETQGGNVNQRTGRA